MTIEDYTRNLKGVNDGSSFSAEFLVRRLLKMMRRRLTNLHSKTSMITYENER